ncbi:MAG: EamA family transporter [Chloroflexaceae bacterium]|nr:EamA family transporter [Chloroflexaceae bacterium]
MLWILLATITAFAEATRNVVIKGKLSTLPAQFVSWVWVTVTLLFLLPTLWFLPPVTLQPNLWGYWLASVLINTLAILLFTLAIQMSDLSLTMPMIAFSPLFMLLTSPLMLGEFPSLIGVVGVVLVVIGSYLLNIQERSNGYLAPYRALLREPGPRLMLGVAVLWSISANLDKLGVQASSPVVWIILVNMGLSLAFVPLMLRQTRQLRQMRVASGMVVALLAIGMLDALALITQMYALTLTLVAYVISVKRAGIIISVVLGAVLFKEPGFRERLTGTLVMLAGVLCIAFA